MPFISAAAVRRRHFIQAGAAYTLAALSRPALGIGRPDGPDALTMMLRPGPAQVRMVGDEFPATDVWTYGGVEPGPVLRVRQGTPFRATVENQLAETTTVHWHGIRLPNAMDGVPGLTQKPIAPGEHFGYAFTPPDAGTYWYHSHDDSLVQMGRGLAGALIVVGNTVTINGLVTDAVRVHAGERVRLRLLNAAIARIMALRFEGHRPVIVALDGQPCEPHEPKNGRILLGPAMRADVMLDMQGEPGRSYRVVDDFYDRLTYTLVHLSYDPAAPLRSHPSDAPVRLPPNPVPRPDLATAAVHEVRLQGGLMTIIRVA